MILLPVTVCGWILTTWDRDPGAHGRSPIWLVRSTSVGSVTSSAMPMTTTLQPWCSRE